MIAVPMRTKGAYDRTTILSVNRPTKHNTTQTQAAPSSGHTASTPQTRQAARAQSVPPQTALHPIPALIKPIQKGQKAPLGLPQAIRTVKACFGWNTKNPACDVDVSAFLLGNNGKVLGDSWFVFYGQTASPDQSVVWKTAQGIDREILTIDVASIHPSVHKIVFVLTIHEALQQHLHFGMMQDAYVRILASDGHTELVSYPMTEYYSNVISMMIGEIYRYNGAWKFNAVGNGVARDLAGLCALYGVQVID